MGEVQPYENKLDRNHRNWCQHIDSYLNTLYAYYINPQFASSREGNKTKDQVLQVVHIGLSGRDGVVAVQGGQVWATL